MKEHNHHPDPVVDEVRAARDAIAKACDDDIDRIAEAACEGLSHRRRPESLPISGTKSERVGIGASGRRSLGRLPRSDGSFPLLWLI